VRQALNYNPEITLIKESPKQDSMIGWDCMPRMPSLRKTFSQMNFPVPFRTILKIDQ